MEKIIGEYPQKSHWEEIFWQISMEHQISSNMGHCAGLKAPIKPYLSTSPKSNSIFVYTNVPVGVGG